MTMPDQHDVAALKKLVKTLEEQTRDAHHAIDELRSRDALKTQLKWMHPGCKRPDVQLCELIGQCARVR